MIHAIDPGVNLSAIAHGDASGLVSLTAENNHAPPAWTRNCRAGDLVVCEQPVFRGRFARDIGDLRQVVGKHQAQAEAVGATWRQVEPAAWKGQLKKPHQHRKLWTVLRPRELQAISDFLGRSSTTIGAWIFDACADLAMGREPNYGRGRRHGTPYTLKDNDALDAVALLMVALGRL